MTPVEIVLPRNIADRYGPQIEHVDPARLRLVPIVGDDPRDPDPGDAEIAVNAFFYDSPAFSTILPGLPNLRWIHSMGAGIDDIATPELVERCVHVTNVSGAYAPAMAEYIVGAMVMLARPWRRWIVGQASRDWEPRRAPSGVELRGKTIGIVGYGAVGRQVAQACRALGMSVWAIRRTPIFASSEPVDRLLGPSGLYELLEASDVVAVCASLNASTRSLLGEAEFGAMRPGSFLVNVARGEVVDQAALVATLESGHLGGAVLDVATPEPLPADDALWDAPNLFLSPHTAGDTPEGWQRGIDLFCSNLGLYLAGRPEHMGNIVDLRMHI